MVHLRISNIPYAVCSAGEIIVLVAMVGINTESNTKILSIIIAFSMVLGVRCLTGI